MQGILDMNKEHGRIHIEVGDWFKALIPPRFPQRKIALTAAEHTTRVLRQILPAFTPEPSCAHRAATARNVMAAFRAFATWAVALPRKNGTVTFGGHEHMGASGVALVWMNQVSDELLNFDWRKELLCQENPLSNLGGGFLGIARLQTWPWLVDAVALATAGHLRAVVPDAVLFARSAAEVLVHILQLQGQEPFMVEIGVDRGQTSELLLNALPNLTLLGVDPYPGRYNGQVSADRLDQMGAVENMRMAVARFAQFNGRGRLWRQRSDVAARGWMGPAPNLVFVDGEHDFESCVSDVQLWTPRLQPGGVIAGHDYSASSHGVVRAVQHLLPDGRSLYLGPHGVWWWYV